jgi:hypothetical protein
VDLINLVIVRLLSRIHVQRGQTLAEYVLLVSVIAVVVIVAAVVLGGNTSHLVRSDATGV